jgi:hypothetical protein
MSVGARGLSVGVRGFRRLVVVCIVAVAALAWQLSTSAPVRAAALAGVFDSVVVLEDTAGPGDHMSVDASFTIPAGSAAGDTFSLQLAAPFDWVADSFDILDPVSGAVVAHVNVSGSTATFTLTDYVVGKGAVHGTTTLNTFFTPGSVTEGQSVTAHFSSKDQTFTDVVTVGPETTNDGVNRKVFRWADRATQNGLIFAIYAATLDLVPDAAREVTITDIPSAGATVDCASVTMQMAPDAGGVPGIWSRVPAADQTLTCPAPSSPRGFVAVARNIPANYHVRVRGTATVTDPGLSKYTNVADIRLYGQEPIRVKDAVRRFAGSGQATGTPSTTTSTTSTTSSSSTTSTSSTSTTSTSSTTQPTTSSSTTTQPTTSSSTTTPPTTTTTTSRTSTTTSATTRGTRTVDPRSSTSNLPSTGSGTVTSLGTLGVALILFGALAVGTTASRRPRASGRYLAR